MPAQKKTRARDDIPVKALENYLNRTPGLKGASYTAKGMLKLPSDDPGPPRDLSSLFETGTPPDELHGWEPLGPGIVGPKGCRFGNIKIEYSDIDQPFRRFADAYVTYDAVLPAGERITGKARFNRQSNPNLEALSRLEHHFEGLGMALEERVDALDNANNLARTKITSLAPQWQQAFWEFFDFSEECATLREDLDAMGKAGNALYHLIAYRSQRAYSLGLKVREAELLEYQADSFTVKKQAGGRNTALANRRRTDREHTQLWQAQLAALISDGYRKKEIKKRTIEAMADYSLSEWPAKGFVGSAKRQRVFPLSLERTVKIITKLRQKKQIHFD